MKRITKAAAPKAAPAPPAVACPKPAPPPPPEPAVEIPFDLVDELLAGVKLVPPVMIDDVGALYEALAATLPQGFGAEVYMVPGEVCVRVYHRHRVVIRRTLRIAKSA